MTTITTFDFTTDPSWGIMFLVDEHDPDTHWYSCEIFHPTLEELKELATSLDSFIKELESNAMD